MGFVLPFFAGFLAAGLDFFVGFALLTFPFVAAALPLLGAGASPDTVSTSATFTDPSAFPS